jgi:hypothetical protein
LQGPRGEKGDEGPSGPPGPKGEQGPPGQAGSYPSGSDTSPPVDLKKGVFYLSQKHPDKLVHEGIFTVFNEIDEVRSELNTMLRPNGSQQAPARSCYDLFLCNPKLQEGYYWIDPNLGNPSDALHLYCSKPGCSCLDCNAPEGSSTVQQWSGARDTLFSELGYQLTCSVRSSQLELLRLLSSSAHQVFTLHSSSDLIEFIGANGETLTNEFINIDKTSSSRTDFTLTGDPEMFPVDDFKPQEDKFGFELGRACFCDTLQ